MPSTAEILMRNIRTILPEEVPVYRVEPLHAMGMRLPYVLVTLQSGYQDSDPTDAHERLISNWRIEIVGINREENTLDSLVERIRAAFPSRTCLSQDGIEEIVLVNLREVPQSSRGSAMLERELIYQTTERLVR